MLNLIFAIASSALVSISMRISEPKIKNNLAMLAVNYLMCLGLAWGYTGFVSPFPGEQGLAFTLTIGSINGFLYLAGFALFQTNIRKNGVVLSSIFMKLGLLVSMLISMVVFGERPEIWQWLGFILAVAAIILINYQPGEKKVSSKWGLVLILLAGGTADAMSKVFEELGNPALSEHFLLYTFAMALIFCIGLNLVQKKGLPGKKEWLYGMLVGVPNFFSAKFLLGALEDLSAVIVYPACNVATILTVTLAGVLFFKERLEKRQWMAVGIILLALVLLNI